MSEEVKVDGRTTSTKYDRLAFDRAAWNKRAGGVNAKTEGGLMNDLDCREVVEHEKPVHRLMAEMAAQGFTNAEIGLHTGYTPHHVANILRQPFARQHTIKTIEKTVQQEMKEFLEAEVLPNLRVLKQERDRIDNRSSDRQSAANALLDRFLGKPVQPIAEGAKNPAEMTDEELRSQIEREISQTKVN